MINKKSLLKRSISGLLFVLSILVCSLHSVSFVLMIYFIIVIMMHEYYHLSLKAAFIRERVFSILAVAIALAVTVMTIKDVANAKYLLLLILPVVATIISFLYRKSGIDKLPVLIFPYIYIALPFILSQLLCFNSTGEYSNRLFLSVLLIICANDVGAYVFGMSFGQKNGHKLFPSISPKKSWEGVIGGVLLCFVAALAVYFLGFIELSLINTLLIAAIVTVFDTFGDLAESQIKRLYQTKDAGNIMPGHGGLLDRFDGALFVFPMVVLFLKLFSII